MAKNILISIVVSILAVAGFYQYYPLFGGNDNLGAISLTDLAGTNSLSAFPTTYNTNNTTIENALNTLEGTTSMQQVTEIGTLTVGTWNASTITVPYGGTGSTTLTSGGVLYGLGTSAIGATAPCSDGQTIQWTSGVPLCTNATVNQADDYTWTGYHIFGALEFTSASGTNATSTDLDVTGEFKRNNVLQPEVLYSNTAGNTHTGTTATTTDLTYTLSANEMGANTKIVIEGICMRTGSGSGGNSCAIQFGTGSATTTVAVGGDAVMTTAPVHFTATIINKNSQSSQLYTGVAHNPNPNPDVTDIIGGTATRDTSTQLYLGFDSKLGDGADAIGWHGVTITKY